MKRILFIAASIMISASGAAHAAKFCGEIKNAFGPFDYRKASELPQQIGLVESAHFTQEVEQNIKGNSSYIGGDLDYTLRAWPNHHRALASMSRQGILEKAVQVRGAKYPVDCYFLRAFEFTPDDGMTHAVYANHLFAHGKLDEALAEFKRAAEMEPKNPTINYNAGLAYLKTKDYDKALMHAQRAYALGFPLPGLKNRLMEAGKWVDAPVEEKPVEEKPAEEKPAEQKPAE